MIDPYLIPGQACECWNEMFPQSKELLYFGFYHNDKPRFFRSSDIYNKSQISWMRDHFKPKGTEWDFAPAWALDPENNNVCSTCDNDGLITIWISTESVSFDCDRWRSRVRWNYIICGICPDKSRYEGNAWKTSLRMRPEWAKRETECGRLSEELLKLRHEVGRLDERIMWESRTNGK